MTNASIRDFAEQLSDVYLRIEDAKVEAKSILEAAKEAGVNTRALTKVARELVADSAKLLKKYDDEHQLEMFRDAVGIRERKGLTRRAA
jgi:hypothetical protein